MEELSIDGDDDDAVLRANGHEAVMPRQFNWISALGLGFSITNSWIGYLSNFGQNLSYVGVLGCIVCLVIGWAIQLVITMGLAELASAFPSSGGQYHFCYILSSKKTRRYNAYIVGWLSVLAWWMATCSGISLGAIFLQGIVAFYVPSYESKQWHTYLIFLAIAASTMIPMFVAPTRMSWVTQLTLSLTLSGYLVYLITALAMHDHVQGKSFAVATNQANSGWNSGAAWLLAISNAMYAFASADGAIHISEEIPRPGRRVPQIMIMTEVIGIVTSLTMIVVLLYFAHDYEAIRESTLPSLELIYQVTGSRDATLGLLILLWAIYVSCLPPQWVTSGRIAWALARDGGTPFPEYFSKISPKLDFPVRTTLASFGFCSIYGLLYLASTTAFNSIINAAVLFLNLTYIIPQGLLLLRGRSYLPQRYFSLSWVGLVCNIFSVIWVFFQIALNCMPPHLPVTLDSMNYNSVVLTGILVIVNALWFVSGRHTFQGPQLTRMHCIWADFERGLGAD
ncbi:amino acid transporter [Aspergillus saccharolyticus JOP 1030-1]|uniref:Amino acid transporter n=1 Tax=Aspergillus saccharolyticus JOP 1030-1 TaxID=1450539 RepID=A0A319A0B6_9EURO|nr:amino acid transporter [Aspergillus saccharolyticus JOP 1030-1]PYH45738.1 amino acid transporter [Aspergillus saccharolyticus JOP 1030-1]